MPSQWLLLSAIFVVVAAIVVIAVVVVVVVISWTGGNKVSNAITRRTCFESLYIVLCLAKCKSFVAPLCCLYIVFVVGIVTGLKQQMWQKEAVNDENDIKRIVDSYCSMSTNFCVQRRSKTFRQPN